MNLIRRTPLFGSLRFLFCFLNALASFLFLVSLQGGGLNITSTAKSFAFGVESVNGSMMNRSWTIPLCLLFVKCLMTLICLV